MQISTRAKFPTEAAYGCLISAPASRYRRASAGKYYDALATADIRALGAVSCDIAVAIHGGLPH
jgi:hypothetical protein